MNISSDFKYDVIVVGGGHAGCEAAAAAANMGSRVLLITMDMTKFAQMSCNPAIGGIAKGQIVREIDALGGYTALITDKTSIQFRMLNRSKGPAMWSPRSQCDRTLFTIEWRKVLESIPNLFFWQDSVTQLMFSDDKSIAGVVTSLGVQFTAPTVILTVGTFLSGKIHVGQQQIFGGRVGELSSLGLTDQLIACGFESGRMKTGTPARIDGRSVNFDSLEMQDGDSVDHPLHKFSFMLRTTPALKQLPCYVTYTSQDVHDTLSEGFADSPMYSGKIKGIGPRYCPSIEDKIKTFSDKDRHHLFLEPEGVDTCEYYINGFSSSLPLPVQLAGLRKVEGLEQVQIFRPGYAIEYDYFPPTQLKHSLETKLIKGLYFAGQINGTTGYEEAAAQGLLAGINAHLSINNVEPLILARDQAYIGVLIDDLVSKGVDEPYRMFTSRAEFRTLLRQDNADERLTELSFNLGLATADRLERMLIKTGHIHRLLDSVKQTSVSKDLINPELLLINSSVLNQTRKCVDLLLRPEISLSFLLEFIPELASSFDTVPSDMLAEVIESVEILIKYEGYIERERLSAIKTHRLEDIIIPDTFDYSKVKSLSTESMQKFIKVKPRTIGQASRIPGVKPSDISILLVFIGR